MYFSEFKAVDNLTRSLLPGSRMQEEALREDVPSGNTVETSNKAGSFCFGTRVEILPPHPYAGETGVVLNVLRFADGTEAVRVGVEGDVINCGTGALSRCDHQEPAENAAPEPQ